MEAGAAARCDSLAVGATAGIVAKGGAGVRGTLVVAGVTRAFVVDAEAEVGAFGRCGLLRVEVTPTAGGDALLPADVVPVSRCHRAAKKFMVQMGGEEVLPGRVLVSDPATALLRERNCWEVHSDIIAGKQVRAQTSMARAA